MTLSVFPDIEGALNWYVATKDGLLGLREAIRCGAALSDATLACEKSALFSPMFYSPAFTFSSVYSLGFGFLAGLRLLVLRLFSVFLQAVRRLGGTMFFRSLRPSLIQQFLFSLLGLTVQSSRPAFGRRLTFFRSSTLELRHIVKNMRLITQTTGIYKTRKI
jgi:hypothetical protein